LCSYTTKGCDHILNLKHKEIKRNSFVPITRLVVSHSENFPLRSGASELQSFWKHGAAYAQVRHQCGWKKQQCRHAEVRVLCFGSIPGLAGRIVVLVQFVERSVKVSEKACLRWAIQPHILGKHRRLHTITQCKPHIQNSSPPRSGFSEISEQPHDASKPEAMPLSR
jgi:hypothetical protein